MNRIILSTLENKIPTINRGYTAARQQLQKDISSTGGFIGSLMKFKNNQGEMLNNLTTAGGTAFVAPLFIIFNPLANEDIKTKEYTAARQPISAVITLAAQIPLMNAYNGMLDKIAATWRLDKYDLSAKPPKSFIENGVKQKYKNYIENCIKTGTTPRPKSEMLREITNELQDKPFYNELSLLRKSIKTGKNMPDYLAQAMENGEISIKKLVAPKNLDEAKSEVFVNYLKDKYKAQGFDPKAEGIKSLADFQKYINRDKLDALHIDRSKEEIKKIKDHIKNADIDGIAERNLKEQIRKETKIKLYTSKLYSKAQAKLDAYERELILKKTPKEKMKELMLQKNEEILEMLRRRAHIVYTNAPESVSINDKFTLDKVEAKTVLKKICHIIDEKEATNIKGRAVRNLRVHGKTWEEVLASVKVKKLLTARINIAEKLLSDFKQKSGILVGLAILPLTCGLLNWSYPRIMEEWFPNLCDAKKNAAQKKGG